MNKILLLIIDGLGDRPSDIFRRRTPLEEAKTPLMDRLAREGSVGLIKPFQRGLFPTSEDAHFTLFGYDVNHYQIGRGVFEALGLELELNDHSVAWRGNWATLDRSGRILDRRAGRIPASEEMIDQIRDLTIDGVRFRVYPGLEHRLVVIMEGEGLSDQVSDGYRRQVGVPPSLITPLDRSEEANFTARLVNRYLNQIHSSLKNNPANQERIRQNQPPVNYILLRGAGRIKTAPSFKEQWGWSGACVAAGPLYRGVSKFVGLKIIDVPGVTAGIDTNLDGKIKASIEALLEHDFVFCHIKATDSLSHMRDCQGKLNFLEKIDQSLRPLFDQTGVTLILTGDHATPCETGEHSSDLIPMLAWGDQVPKDKVTRFGESFCAKGGLGVWDQIKVLEKAAKLTKRNGEF